MYTHNRTHAQAHAHVNTHTHVNTHRHTHLARSNSLIGHIESNTHNESTHTQVVPGRHANTHTQQGVL
jgi:hypothetical protein